MNQNLGYTAALQLSAFSDDINIPSPDLIVNGAGLTTDVGFNVLKSATATFVSSQAAPGMIVWNVTGQLCATIVEVIDENTLLLSSGIFTSIGEEYKVFSLESQGCYIIYLDTRPNDVRVLTTGGDDIVFSGMKQGKIIPVRVLRVFSSGTSATNLTAIW